MDATDGTMKIRAPRTDLNQGSQQAGAVSGKSSVDSSQNSDATASNTDTVTFTTTASEMLKLEESLANIPDIDNSRVDAIKASLADGSYQIDPEKIVNSLLSIEKDLT
mgnify:CR=1 FL=1